MSFKDPIKRKEYRIAYKKLNKEKFKKWNNDWRKKTGYSTIYYQRNKEKLRSQSRLLYAALSQEKRIRYAEIKRASRLKLKLELFEKMGGKCSKCGFSDHRALQIDHINGGGTKDIKNHKTVLRYQKSVLFSVESGEKKYQILCANCNWIKRFERKEFSPGRKYYAFKN